MSVLLNAAQRILTERPVAVERLITANSDLLTDDELVTLFNEPDSGIHDYCFDAIIYRLKASNPISHTVIKLFRNQDPELRKRFFDKLGRPTSDKDRDAKVYTAINRVNPALKGQYLAYWEEKDREARKHSNKVLNNFLRGDEREKLEAAQEMFESLVCVSDPNSSPYAGYSKQLEAFYTERQDYGRASQVRTAIHIHK